MRQLAPPKVLAINLLTIVPTELFGEESFPNQAWKFDVEFSLTPQIHSDMRTPRPGTYNAHDVVPGDCFSTEAGKVLQIESIFSRTDVSVHCTAVDHFRLNATTDVDQTGESIMDTGAGVLFTVKNNTPILYPLPPNLSNELSTRISEITARFAYTGETAGISTASDVDVSDLRNGSVLVYNSEIAKWKATTTLSEQQVDGGEY